MKDLKWYRTLESVCLAILMALGLVCVFGGILGHSK